MQAAVIELEIKLQLLRASAIVNRREGHTIQADVEDIKAKEIEQALRIVRLFHALNNFVNADQ